ncbi:MAG: hypothetical protein A3F72_17795 [Bacteroidetes bacterium RIFCSPLOWO2_12_FULL_35_15]|nr:MAG: hypothetical protein A3F72_17795 [Bacteroidetes bacterium RIFCSPLOWO2_12_FULL_35_15]
MGKVTNEFKSGLADLLNPKVVRVVLDALNYLKDLLGSLIMGHPLLEAVKEFIETLMSAIKLINNTTTN